MLYLNSIFLDFPSQSRSTKHGSIALLEFADENLNLALEHLHDVLVKGLANWVHDVIATLGQTAKDYECLGTLEGNKVGKCLTQNSACVVKDIKSQLIALYSAVIHVFRGDVLDIIITKQ